MSKLVSPWGVCCFEVAGDEEVCNAAREGNMLGLL